MQFVTTPAAWTVAVLSKMNSIPNPTRPPNKLTMKLRFVFASHSPERRLSGRILVRGCLKRCVGHLPQAKQLLREHGKDVTGAHGLERFKAARAYLSNLL